MGNRAPARSGRCTCNTRPAACSRAPGADILRSMAFRRDMSRRAGGSRRAAAPGRPIAALATVVLLATTFAGIAPSACTRVSDTQRFPLVSERLTIARTVPEQGARIALGTQLDFCFSGFVDPRALDDFDVSLSSGLVTFDTQVELQLFAWRPPGAAVGEASEAWCPGSVLSVFARTPLRPGALYHLRLQPSAVGWAGEQLDVTTPGWVHNEEGSAFLLEFTVEGEPDSATDTGGDSDTDADTDTGDTGDTTGDTTGGEPEAPTLHDLFAPGQVFAVDNPACSCHREGDQLARDRLDLRTPELAFADLVLPTGLMATGFPMVAPRRPAESYLVQTLLRDPDGTALYGVLGEPMPPDEPLAYAEMVAIVRWIEGGALP